MAIPAAAVVVPFGALFFFSGLIVNLIQAFLYITVCPFSKKTYIKINKVVVEMLWLEFVWLADWWAKVKIEVYADAESFRLMGKERALVICNHKSDIDWLVGWILAERSGCLGSSFSVTKKSAKYLPVIGWSTWFSGAIFLERSWEKDENTLKHGFRRLMDFPCPFWLGLFIEGTRFTQAKLLAAPEYASSMALPSPRNVLIPRTKGFVAAVNHMRTYVPAIYDPTFAFPKDLPPPTMLGLLKQESSVVHVHIKRHLMNELPETNDAIAQWCKDVFLIPSSGWDKLFISLIPTELGKTSAKTSKANVRNGTCKWGDPIYETTRLLQDTKTRIYDEKLYKLVVSMGSSRASILGEATINLADYADASKPSAVAMPLHGCNSGAILHVTVQLLTSKTGFREFEQQRELRERGLQIGADSNRVDESGTSKSLSLDAITSDQMHKVHTKVKLRQESDEFPSHGDGLNEESTDLAVGYDGSSNTSESFYAEKNDCLSRHEIDSLKSTVSGDLSVLSHCQSPKTEKRDTSDHQFLAQGRSDWVQRWGSEYSIDNGLAIAYEENNRLRGSLEVAESTVEELKMEVSSLRNYADELGSETQNFASKLVSEIASGEELANEILLLKSESSKFKNDIEQLKRQKSRVNGLIHH